MGYGFRELYVVRNPPPTQWRGSAREAFFKQYTKYLPHSASTKRQKLVALWVIRPIMVIGLTASFSYYALKSRGWLHMLNNPVEGAKEYLDNTTFKFFRDIKSEVHAYRHKMAYERAIEKKQLEIMKRYKMYEEALKLEDANEK